MATHTLNVVLRSVHFLKHRNRVGRRLARATVKIRRRTVSIHHSYSKQLRNMTTTKNILFGTRKDIPASQCNGNGLLLNGRWSLKARLKDAHEKFAFEEVILKVIAFRVGHVLSASSRTE